MSIKFQCHKFCLLEVFRMSLRKCPKKPKYIVIFVDTMKCMKQLQDITSFVMNACYTHFGVRLGNQDKSWDLQRPKVAIIA